MKDLGIMHYFLGLEVWQFLDEIFLNQGKYTIEILKRFGILDCKSINTPMVKNLKLLNDDSLERLDITLYKNIIGSLVYLTNTRPNICFVVNTLSRYMLEPKNALLIPTKHVIRCLKGRLDYGLRYASDSEIILHDYEDSYCVGSVENKKITSRFCFSLGSCVILGLNINHTSVGINMTEVEYKFQHVNLIAKQYGFTSC